MKSLSYASLEQIDWPEDIFIEGGLLSRGDTMLIAADSKAGKSTFICGLMRQIITGGNFLGFKVTRPLKVFYMQAELRERRLKERLMPTYSSLSDEYKRNIYIWSTRGLVMLNENTKEIEAELMQVRPDILVIDPMLNFHNLNENNAQEMATFFRYLDHIKEQHDMAIIMAHHFRKASQDPKAKSSLLESMRGSTALRGWAVTTIAMEGRGNGEYRELEFDLRNSDESLKRVIKYNKTTKDFDWHDPVAIVYEWAKKYLTTCQPSVGQFVEAMKAAHHELLSNNHSRAFNVKKELMNTKLIYTTTKGKTHIVHLT